MKNVDQYLEYLKVILTKATREGSIAMHYVWCLVIIVVTDDDLFTRIIKTLLKSVGFANVANRTGSA